MTRRKGVLLAALGAGACLALAVYLVPGCCAPEMATDLSTNTAFRWVVANPVPPGITDIQGGGVSWLDYHITLRFKATEESLRKVLQTHDMQPKTLSPDDMDHLFKDVVYGAFDPPWNPPTGSNAKCYFGKRSKDRPDEHLYILHEAAGMVYCVAESGPPETSH